MLADYALMSFEGLGKWIPELRESDQGILEMYINSASLRIRNLYGEEILRNTYTEIHDYKRTIQLKKSWVSSLTSITYDAYRKWDGENDSLLVEDTDYFYEDGSRIINLYFTTPPFNFRKSLQIIYTAGRYRVDYVSEATPSDPLDGQVWLKENTRTYKLYSGSAWTEISSTLIIDDLFINAMVEALVFNKARILQDNVGIKSKQGSSVNSYHQQVEIDLPKNIHDMLGKEIRLL